MLIVTEAEMRKYVCELPQERQDEIRDELTQALSQDSQGEELEQVVQDGMDSGVWELTDTIKMVSVSERHVITSK